MMFKKIWDALMILVLLYILTYYPFRIMFLYESLNEMDGFFVFDIMIDIFFIMDIILNFFTTEENNGVMIDEYRDIAYNYLSSWFIPDIISM